MKIPKTILIIAKFLSIISIKLLVVFAGKLFVTPLLELEKRFSPFEADIDHSLRGMFLLNAVKRGLRINHLVIRGYILLIDKNYGFI